MQRLTRAQEQRLCVPGTRRPEPDIRAGVPRRRTPTRAKRPLTGASLARPRTRGGTPMKRLLSLGLFVLLATAVFAQDSGYSGQWMVDQSRDPAKLQLTFRYSDPD